LNPPPRCGTAGFSREYILSLRAALLALALLAAPAAARAQATPVQPPETPAQVAFGAKVRAYLLRHPEVLAEAFDRLQAQQAAQKAADAKALIAANQAALERDPRDPVLGNPKGKVSVVEFFDYRCPYCRAAEPSLEAILAANPDVRLVLKEFPILDLEDSSHISEDAARAALAANAQGRFGPVHRALFARKVLDEAGIVEVLKAAGVDLDKAKAVETATATTTQLADVHALARTLGVDGTPAFVVGERMIPGADLDALRQAIADARKAGATVAPKR
jgi:protein-disulfide isomerase